MNCEQFRENLVAYLRDELNPNEKAEMDDHISAASGGCVSCTRELGDTESTLRIASASGEESVTRIVYTYIQQAIRRDASDLHFEARRGKLTVRCRVDGVLCSLDESVRASAAESPDDLAALDSAGRALEQAVMNRLKVMADVDVAGSDAPQSGRITIRLDQKEYTLPASFMPADNGSDAVLRILPRQAPLTLEAMGMSDQVRSSVQRMLDQPMGLVLVGGPTGSGKTSVVMSLAQHMAGPGRKVVTVEDPVCPTTMENVTQIEVAEHRGLSTLALLSRVAHLDPDVIAVHTIGDSAVTAKCVSLALGGRLVMSTLHAKDAADTVWRLAEMLGDRNLAASCLIGATNQRLVRRICADCREQYTPSPQALKSLYLDPSSMMFEHGSGCEKCRNTGYFRRTSIFEVLEMTRELEDLLAAGADPAVFQSRARAATTPTLIDDGRRLVMEGVTTAEEVCRVIPLPR